MDYFVMWKDETPIRCNNLTEAAIVITAQESDGKMFSECKTQAAYRAIQWLWKPILRAKEGRVGIIAKIGLIVENDLRPPKEI